MKKLLSVSPRSRDETVRVSAICGNAGRMMLVARAPRAESPARRNKVSPAGRRSDSARFAGDIVDIKLGSLNFAWPAGLWRQLGEPDWSPRPEKLVRDQDH